MGTKTDSDFDDYHYILRNFSELIIKKQMAISTCFGILVNWIKNQMAVMKPHKISDSGFSYSNQP